MAPTSAQARASVLRSWAHTPDRAARTAAARAASFARFEREVDPDGILDPRERAIRAEMAQRAFMTECSIKAAAARKAKSVTSAARVAGDRPTPPVVGQGSGTSEGEAA